MVLLRVLLHQQQIWLTSPTSLSNRNTNPINLQYHIALLLPSRCANMCSNLALHTTHRFKLYSLISSTFSFIVCFACHAGDFHEKLDKSWSAFVLCCLADRSRLGLGRENALSWPSTKDDDDENVVSDFRSVLPLTPTTPVGYWLGLQGQSLCGQAGYLI